MVSSAIALKRMGQPYIVCSHGIYHPAMLSKGRWKKWLIAPLERYALRNADAVQLLSDLHAVHLRNFGVKNRIIIFPNGFYPQDIPKFQSGEARPLEPVKILFLGRLDVSTKGLDLLVDAVSRLVPRFRIELSLIGPNWRDVEALKKRAEALNDSVKFCGPDYARHPVEIISNYDLLALPSRHEGFGLSGLEAMVAGIPVVVSSEAGIAESVRRANAGWIVAPAVESIELAISEAIAHRAEWPAIGARGKEYAFANLTWGAIAARASKSYEELLSMSSKR